MFKAYRLEESPGWKRGTPEENWCSLEQMRASPLLAALRPEYRLDPMRRAPINPPRTREATVNDDFRDFLRALDEHGVRYLLVGGWAVVVHGHVRYTRDLDVWVERDPENAARVVRAFQAFGLEGPSPDMLLREDVFYRVGQGATVIDVFTGIGPGFRFADHLERALWVNVDGLRVPVLGFEDLIRVKTRAGRPQDVADVAALKAVRDDSA